MYRLEFVSNQDFSDSEFNKWRETMLAYNVRMPTLRDVQRKDKDIKFAFSYKFRDEDIDTVSGNNTLGSQLGYISIYNYQLISSIMWWRGSTTVSTYTDDGIPHLAGIRARWLTGGPLQLISSCVWFCFIKRA